MNDLKTMPSLWSILPEELNKLRQAWQTYSASNKPSALNGRAQTTRIPETFFMEGNLAVMQIEGVIMPKANLFSLIFGGATLDVMTRDFNALVADGNVKAIVLDIDSPGGNVFGIQEFANLVFEGRSSKQIVAVTSTIMTSAAMWIGAAASDVFITGETTITGSLAALTSHLDISGLEQKLGIKTTEISSGTQKRIDSSFAPLTEEGRKELQSRVDYIGNVIAEDIARFRGLDIKTVTENISDGKIFIGSQAINAGLVDGIKNREEIFSLINEAARIKDVEAQLLPGHEALIKSFRRDGKTTGPQAAIAVLKAEKKKTVQTGNLKNNLDGREAMIMTAKKDFKTLVSEYKENHNCGIIDAVKAITTQYPEAHEKYIQTLKQKWDSSPELRKEFGDNFDSCQSYFKHEDDCPVTDQKVAAHATIKDAWDSMPELRKEFGGDFTNCKVYFENEFKTTGKMSFKS